MQDKSSVVVVNNKNKFDGDNGMMCGCESLLEGGETSRRDAVNVGCPPTTAWDRRLLQTDGRAAKMEVDDEQDGLRGEDEWKRVVNRDIGACQRRREEREDEGSGEDAARFLIATCPSRGFDIQHAAFIDQWRLTT